MWSVLRWPIGFALVVGFLICLYRFSANVRHRGATACRARSRARSCGSPPPSCSASRRARATGAASPATTSVTLIGQAVNAVVSTVLWAYLASIAILLGGELNAVLRARRAAEAGGLPAARARRRFSRAAG